MLSPENRYYFFGLAISSGIILSVAWPTLPFGFLLHVGFVPLLLARKSLEASSYKNKSLKFFGYSYLAMLIWNILTTWWVYNASPGGSIFAIIANAFLMCIPLMLYWYTARKVSPLIGLVAFVSYWIAFEYTHLNWDLTWPWLTLGNGFASLHQFVQWYEYTGHLGGSLWVLVTNAALYLIIGSVIDGKKKKVATVFASLWVLIPVLISLTIYYTHEEEGDPVEVVVLQPNVDPYNEKFAGSENFIPYDEQAEIFLKLSEQAITPETKFIAWPETALSEGYWEEQIETYSVIQKLKAFTSKYPQVSLITGIDSYRAYPGKETSSARYNPNIGYYDVFNAALFLGSGGQTGIYHKSKLVPGVEHIPAVIKDFAIDMGGTVGGLGRAKETSVFYNKEGIGAAPVICYESIFGEYVTEYVKKGANFILVITNDGWWGDTPGHRQHLQYGKLRCIETRKSMARSANTGISAFINQRGDITSGTGYWEQKVMKGTVLENDVITFYVAHGDFIGKFSLYGSALILLFLFTFIFRSRNNDY